jgi:hypothetical protein
MRRKAGRSSYIKDVKQPTFSEKSACSTTTKVQEVVTTCPICQEPVGSRNPEGITEDWSCLPCGHRFGSHCIKHYLRIVADDRPSCPICRQIAYHGCGHPVLPVLLDSTNSIDICVDSKKATELVRNLQGTFCCYCRAKNGDAPMRALKRPRRRLRAAGAWLLSIATAPRRLLGRRQPRPREHAVVYRRGTLLQPWDDDEVSPWLDPYPRARDAQWERWWDAQEPGTSS